ncbi:hypothetical protein MMC19_002078 [Ptychographa xylographoides]|nr:hypothetical protein [Ptychographa xylographoides]
MDSENSFLHPLTFLHNRLSALTTFSGITSPICHDGDEESPSAELNATPGAYIPDHEAIRDSESFTDVASVVESKRRSVRRTTTSFQLAHPAPCPKHKQRRRVLLQLRQISETCNPIPTLEVLPATRNAHRLKRHFPRLGRKGLGVNDLVIVNSQEYGSPEKKENSQNEDSDDEDWENREIVGIISPPGKGDQDGSDHARIFLGHDTIWTASKMKNGGYEFNTTDHHGLKTTARWVVKVTKPRHKESDPQAPSYHQDDHDKKFKFSVLNPLSRRHPVIGSMDRHSIDVCDQWITPSTPSLTPTPNSPACFGIPSPQQHYFDEQSLQPSAVNDTDEHLKTLMLITGIWVGLAEGWFDCYKAHGEQCNSTTTTATNSPAKDRNASGHFDTGSNNGSATPSSFTSARSRHTSFNFLHRSAGSNNPTPPTPASGTEPQRARSLGNGSARNPMIRQVSFAKPRIQGSVRETSPTGRTLIPAETDHRARTVSNLYPASCIKESPLREESRYFRESLEHSRDQQFDIDAHPRSGIIRDSIGSHCEASSQPTDSCGTSIMTDTSSKKTGKRERLRGLIGKGKKGKKEQ